MNQEAKHILKKYYGYDDFRKGQEKIIESIVKGNDTFTIMPTGGGKSICFQVPAMLLPGITIVVSPLISLMKDQIDNLTNIDIPATYINSSLSYSEINQRMFEAQNGLFKLIYVAPERLESMEFIELLKRVEISMIAIDEAHCVSQWGHDFRPSYKAVGPFIRQLSPRPIVSAFTATATEEVGKDIIKLLELRNPHKYKTGFDRENLTFSVIRGKNKKDFIDEYLQDNKDKSGIIYTATRKEVENMHKRLSQQGYSVGKYHAGMSDQERKESQEAFIYDEVNLIIATNAFGMGIDKPNVRYVIHYSMPKNMEAYYQEVGRAGRDGEKSECILIFSPQDIILQKFMIEQSEQLSEERKLNEYEKLQTIIDYCHTSQCLRKYILEYFGEEEIQDNCSNCSTCNDKRELTDITIEAQKIFSCIVRMKERFGSSMVSDVLRGSKNKKLVQFGLDNLSTYGIIKDYTVQEIKDMINILIAEGYLALTEGQYPVIKLQERAKLVLKNEERVLQRLHKIKTKSKERENVKESEGLFDILRTWRKETAYKEQVPPYVIFADATLHELCKYLPTQQKDMLNIKGIGESKFKKYGEQVIEMIQDYIQKNNIMIKNDIEENSIVDELKESNKKSKKEEDKSHVISYNLYKQGKTIEEIAQERKVQRLTIEEHIFRCAYEGLEVNLDEWIPQQYEQLIKETIQKIGAEKLKPIKEALPEEITYLNIKAVLCKMKM